MYFFINHTKHFIIRASNDTKKNISNSLCNTIRDNQWSICDHIEFVDYRYCGDNDREKIKLLIKNLYYNCSHEDAILFYL